MNPAPHLAQGRFIVYGLRDPRDGRIRYIGKSSTGLRRPMAHVSPSGLKERNHKALWLRTLLAAGKRPEVVALEATPSKSDLNDMECFWIAQARGIGWAITNQTKGGDGGLRGGWNRGCKHRPETIEKIRASVQRRGYRHNPATRARIAAGRTGTRRVNGRWVRPGGK